MLSTVFAPRIHQAVERRSNQDKVTDIIQKNFPRQDFSHAKMDDIIRRDQQRYNEQREKAENKNEMKRRELAYKAKN